MPSVTHPGREVPRHLTSQEIWRAIGKASFLVVRYVTPSGEPRWAGVVCTVIGQKLYVVTGQDSWKARHIAADDGRVAVTVPVRPVLDQLGSLLPKERRDAAAIIEIAPQGTFATYGVGMALASCATPTPPVPACP